MNLKKPVYEVIHQAHNIIDVVNVWAEDDGVVVRVLDEVAQTEAESAEEIRTEEDLKSIKLIMPNVLFQSQYRFYFKIGEKYYKLISENSLIPSDKWWQENIYVGGANIIFGYRHYGFMRERPSFLPAFDIRSATNRKYKDNEFLHIEGVDVICAIYCRSSTDRIKDCAFELFHRKDAILLTNLEVTGTEELPLTKYKFFHQYYHSTEEMFVIELPEGMEKIPVGEEVEITVTAKCFTTDAPRYQKTPSCDIIDTEFNDERYLVADGGYLPAKRIKFVNGVAKARFFADRMKSGDKVQFHIESFANQYTTNPTIFEVA